jgi:Domain of unknown function (DUF6815)
MTRVGLLWRSEWDRPVEGRSIVESCKLRGVFRAFQALGVTAEPVIYSDDRVEVVRDQLLRLDGVLVWVNPVEQGRDRSKLDPLLREVVDAGVWVSAHPDVISRMATKQVLVETRQMSWGTDTKVHRTAEELRRDLPARLAVRSALVLKQQRGMGGNGVWKVESGDPSVDGDTMLRVQHAARGSVPEQLSLDEFVTRCAPYFVGDGSLVEQPYQERLREGLLRVYLTHDQVVGFAHQYAQGLMPPADVPRASPAKVFELPSAPAFGGLRGRMESEWVPQMQGILNLHTHSLPVIWDADFLYGPKTSSGHDTYVLCEVNASSTFAFPEHAMPAVARAAIQRIQERTI